LPVGLAPIRRAAAAINHALAPLPITNPWHSDILTVLPVRHPAEIGNYRSMATTPALLAFGRAPPNSA
jgi:hypothetical protein